MGNPSGAISSAYDSTANYLSGNSIGDIASDTLQFVSGGFATAGMGKIAGVAGSFSLNSMKNSSLLFRATDSGNLSRVTSELPTGLNPVPAEKFDLWSNYLTKRGVEFEIGTPKALSMLEEHNAYGLFKPKYNWETNTYTPTIYLPKNPNASVFYEESLHALDYLRSTPREINLNGIKVDNWELRAKQTILNSPNRLSYEEATLLEQHMKLVKQGKY